MIVPVLPNLSKLFKENEKLGFPFQTGSNFEVTLSFQRKRKVELFIQNGFKL